MTYKIGEVARLAKVSIRTLHHYDAIGLLVPNARSDSGYRLYTHSDLERLQQILFYKTLEFPLEEIHRLMTDPTFNRSSALLQQRELLEEKSTQLKAVLKLIDKTIVQMDEEFTMDTKAMFDVFPELTQDDLDDAEAQWGETEQYKESLRRTSQYTKADFQSLKEENDAITEAIITLMDEGIAADDPRAIAIIERHRLLIDKWSPCTKGFHMTLADMYVTDERFRNNYEKLRPGMAEYIQAAVKANR
ncbi:MerR family transcriptional regulator [Gammaproteobacteria bacterium]|nr:MerR family transcriptional regulator [Gammaproteobacteria bacterium]